MLLPLTAELDVPAVAMGTTSEAEGGWAPVGAPAVGATGHLWGMLILSEQIWQGSLSGEGLSHFPDPMQDTHATPGLSSGLFLLRMLLLGLFCGCLLLCSILKCWGSPELFLCDFTHLFSLNPHPPMASSFSWALSVPSSPDFSTAHPSTSLLSPDQPPLSSQKALSLI